MEEKVTSLYLSTTSLLRKFKPGNHTRSIWFTDEDITEADYPYMQQLLEESFRQWISEAEELWEDSGAVITVFDMKVVPVASYGQGTDSGLSAAFHVMGMAAQSVLLSGETEHSEFSGAGSRGEFKLSAVPIYGRKEPLPIAIMVAAYPQGASADMSALLLQSSALHFRSCFYRSYEHLFVKDMLLQQRHIEMETQRKEALFRAAKRLHDQTDVTSVLNEILKTLESLYPDSHVDLFLSQDYMNVDKRVKPLVFNYESEDLCARAFLEGRSLTERGRDGSIRLAVPLSGKQAIYGVLQLFTRIELWDEADMPAFTILADTAGGAFENAKLYEQSNLLISELQLINELTKRLNQSLRLKEIFQFTTNELLHIFKADFSCLLQYNKESKHFTVVSCNVPGMENGLYSSDYGFSGLVYHSKEALIISDYENTQPVSSQLMEHTSSRSLIASPILVNDEVVGVILVAHKNPNFFSYENYKLLQVLSTHIGLAVTNTSLHAEVRRMVITDNLTGLRARHYLNEQIQLRQLNDACGSLILVDIDYFKQVNDTFGHLIGDQILTQVSDIIKTCIRRADIAARWGGEELAVYLPKISADQAFRIAERIRETVAKETDPVVTVSCGISEWMFEDEKISVESLFYRADMALYGAKHNGRNRVFIG